MDGPSKRVIEVGVDAGGVFVACRRRDAGQQVDIPGSCWALRRSGRIRIESDCRAADLVVRTLVMRAGSRCRPSPAERRCGRGRTSPGFASGLLDNLTQDDEADVGVVEDLPRVELQRCGQCTVNAVGLVGCRQSPRTLVAQVAPIPEVWVSNIRSVTWARRGSLAALNSGRYV